MKYNESFKEFAQWLLRYLDDCPEKDTLIADMRALIILPAIKVLNQTVRQTAIAYLYHISISGIKQGTSIWDMEYEKAPEHFSDAALVDALIKWLAGQLLTLKSMHLLRRYGGRFENLDPHSVQEDYRLQLMYAAEIALGITSLPWHQYATERYQEAASIKRMLSRVNEEERRRSAVKAHNDRIWHVLLGIPYDPEAAKNVDWRLDKSPKSVSSKELIQMLATVRNHTLYEAAECLVGWLLKNYVGDDIKRFKEDVERCWNGAEQGSLLEEILGIVREEINE